ncbi:acylphosphatase [Candidatus Parcubacteria bacterium]|nr:MAG: acylphosphatase [Candidatus Parcubacteria bacterium]
MEAEKENGQVRLTIHVAGRVQGVFFRESARRKAIELGLTGYARNELDGSVTLEVEGNVQQAKHFLDWCRKGPPLARVQQVIYRVAPSRQEFIGFVVQ